MSSLSYDPVECLAKNCRAKSTLAYCERFGNLGHFNVDCKAEELTQELHLVIWRMDSSLKKDSQTSSVPRVYYEPFTSPTSEASLLLIPSTETFTEHCDFIPRRLDMTYYLKITRNMIRILCFLLKGCLITKVEKLSN